MSACLLCSCSVLFVILSLLSPRAAFGWGDKGHEMINRLAVQAMPPEAPRFFREAVERLTYLGPEPDRWRPGQGAGDVSTLNAAAAPDHFIDLEFVASFPLPRTRYDYLRALLANGVVSGDVKIETPGFLPYRIVELTEMLRREWAFWRGARRRTRAERDRRRQNEENIIHIAGILGHYVGDGSNPHHTTWHYNGWVEAREPNPEGFTTARGIHVRFESDFVNQAVEIADVRPLVPPLKSISDLFVGTVEYLRVSHAFVRELYRLDKRGAFQVSAAHAEGKRFAVARLAAGAGMLRDLWVAAMRE